MKKVEKYIEAGIRYFTYIIFASILIDIVFAFFRTDNPAEAPIGNFNSIDFNNDWDVSLNNNYLGKMELPNLVTVDA